MWLVRWKGKEENKPNSNPDENKALLVSGKHFQNCSSVFWSCETHLRVQKAQLQLKQSCASVSALRATDHSEHCAGQDYNPLSKVTLRQIISQGFSYYMQKINNQKL